MYRYDPPSAESLADIFCDICCGRCALRPNCRLTPLLSLHTIGMTAQDRVLINPGTSCTHLHMLWTAIPLWCGNQRYHPKKGPTRRERYWSSGEVLRSWAAICARRKTSTSEGSTFTSERVKLKAVFWQTFDDSVLTSSVLLPNIDCFFTD